jgi:hypothetical protein
MRKKLLRLLWVAPVAMLLFAGTASAQLTGTIVGVVNDAATGKPVAGALVIATSKALQGEQTAVTDGKGQYTLTSLPAGQYKLSAQLQGYKPAERTDINLRVDYTIRANIAMVPEAVQMEEQVVKTGAAPAVNIGSAEAGTIVSKEYLAAVPLTSRSYEQAAVIAPTAQRDMYGVSFAGATSPENNYIIDGLRVSDPAVGTLGTNLLTNFVDQLDVKVGSFMPEYGYSSAGIINTVTKSGGNEFHGSIWGNLTPGFFTPSTPAVFNAGQAVASQSTPYKGSYAADFGLELGGPIVKDKLWFYAGFAPQYNYNARTKYYQSRTLCDPAAPGRCVGAFQQDAFGQYVMNPIGGTESVYGSGLDRYFAIAKLTWLINENHNVFASFNTQPTTTFGLLGANGNASAEAANTSANTTNVTLNYTGKFLDKHLLLEARGGWFNSTNTVNSNTSYGLNNLTTPLISWRTSQPLANFVPGFACPLSNAGACNVQQYITGGYGFVAAPKTDRYAGNVSLTGLFDLLGQHQLKGGAQIDYATYDEERYYSGGAIFYGYGLTNTTSTTPSTSNSATGNAFYTFRGYGYLDPNSPYPTPSPTRASNVCSRIDANGNCVNAGIKDPTDPGVASAQTNTWSNGYYLQDSWSIANVLTLNFGVRLDTQTMVNATSTTDATAPKLGINDMWAPRVQAIWDFTGTGRGKIQGNWGMYYESIPLDMAVRAFSGESQIRATYLRGDCANADPKVNPAVQPFASCPNVYGLPIGAGPGPNTINLATNAGVSGTRGFQLTSALYSPVAPDLKGSYTTQFGGGVQYEILQDLTIGVDYLGRRMGDIIEDMSSDDGTNYYIANPTVSKSWTATVGPYQGVTFNPNNAAGLSFTTGNVYSVAWNKPVRSYDAVSVTVNKLFSKKWLAQGSYTWSSLRGNYPGLFRMENAQLDPNITSEYDLVALLGNKTGPLGGNREHQIKVAGAYTATLSPDVMLQPSVNFQAVSGLPVSATACQAIYGCGESYLLPRGTSGNLDWTFQVDAGAKVIWAISGPYTLQFSLDIFNLLNLATTQWVDMGYTLDFATPMQGAQCSSKTAATSKDPLKTLNESCPDLPYARTLEDRRISPNLNYGRPQNSAQGLISAYQAPISARFGVSLSF